MATRIVTAGLAAALLTGVSAPALADCAGDLDQARAAFTETLASVSKPGADWQKVSAPKNEPPGYTGSGGPAPNLPGEGNAKAAGDSAKSDDAAQSGEAKIADAKPAESSMSASGQQASGNSSAEAAGTASGGAAGTDQPAKPEQASASDAQGAPEKPADGAQPAMADAEQNTAEREAAAAAANGEKPGGGQQTASSDAGHPTENEAKQADLANDKREGNPPSSGDMKGNSEASAEKQLEQEKPSLGLALMDINHAEAYASAGNEEACLQSLAKAEDTLKVWRSGS